MTKKIGTHFIAGLVVAIVLKPSYAQSQEIMFINSNSVRIARGYSHAVAFPGLGVVKTSGIIGTNKAGILITATPRDQIGQTFYNLEQILIASGTTVESIDEIETFLTDSVYFKDYVQERIEFFKGRKEPPISKTYYIKGLINPQAIVEINVTATLKNKKQINKGILHITAVLEAKEGEADKLHELLAKNILPSRNEKGCLQYDLFRGGKDKNTFVLQEQWISKEAFDLHFKMPYIKELSRNIKDLVKTSSINTMEKIEE
jgi:quinol monooxygenase YgiN/enamine deaminase RidA (YjgF/YER057c/UK114 family)